MVAAVSRKFWLIFVLWKEMETCFPSSYSGYGLRQWSIVVGCLAGFSPRCCTIHHHPHTLMTKSAYILSHFINDIIYETNVMDLLLYKCTVQTFSFVNWAAVTINLFCCLGLPQISFLLFPPRCIFYYATPLTASCLFIQTTRPYLYPCGNPLTSDSGGQQRLLSIQWQNYPKRLPTSTNYRHPRVLYLPF